MVKFFFLMILVAMAVGACKRNEGPVERAGQTVDRNIEDAADAVEEAADDVEDAAKGRD